jgi:hypothetical protein
MMATTNVYVQKIELISSKLTFSHVIYFRGGCFDKKLIIREKMEETTFFFNLCQKLLIATNKFFHQKIENVNSYNVF